MIITLSANAGLSIQTAGSNILIDAFHDEKVNEFSTITTDIYEGMKQMPEFTEPDILIFTHKHRDHYSRRMTDEMLGGRDIPVIFPEEMDVPGIHVTGKAGEETEIRFFQLPHDGTGYEHIKQYALLIENEEGRILVGGDTKVGCGEMDYLVMNRDIDVAILDFPWTTLKSGRDAICEFVQPKNLVVVHLPFEDDDYSGFRPATKKGVADIKDSIGYSLDVRIMSEPLQHEEIIL
ncbi:MAG: MBL fold metallo-hydrolase [Firmicutes bacterium]|nr:MBL fold metallo-hydrolase [Bacillota bacterium]